MKKILALVLALVMVLCAASALAAGSKTVEDTQNATVEPASAGQGGYYPKTATEELALKIVDATAESQVVLDAFKAAFDAGDALSILPDDIKAQILEGAGTINEMVTAQFVGDTTAVAGEFKATITFETPYEEGAEVSVLLGKLGGEEIKWTVLKGKVNADGAIEVVIPAAVIADLGNNPFILAVVSK